MNATCRSWDPTAALRHPEQLHIPSSLPLTLTASPFLCLAARPQGNEHFTWEDTGSSLEPWQEPFYAPVHFGRPTSAAALAPQPVTAF